MIRKFVAATLMIALAALFYYTNQLEPDESTVTALKSRIQTPHHRTSTSMSSTAPTADKN